jgi:hypothetical protein
MTNWRDIPATDYDRLDAEALAKCQRRVLNARHLSLAEYVRAIREAVDDYEHESPRMQWLRECEQLATAGAIGGA